MTDYERFKAIIRHINKPINFIAKEIGVSQPSLKSCVDGNNKPSFDTIQKLILKYPEINPTWLLTGEGNMLLKEERRKPENNTIETISLDSFLKNFGLHGFSKYPIRTQNTHLSNQESDGFIDVVRERNKLLLRIEKANKLSIINDWYTNIEVHLDMAHKYSSHYNVMQNIIDFLDEYIQKKIEWDDVITEFKKRLTVTMELYKILRPYENVIKEIYEKVSDFNDKHDRLYRFDDIENVNVQPEIES